MADDIGEALDLLVGLGQIGGAVANDGFEIGVGRPSSSWAFWRSRIGALDEGDRQRADGDDQHRSPPGSRSEAGWSCVARLRSARPAAALFAAHLLRSAARSRSIATRPSPDDDRSMRLGFGVPSASNATVRSISAIFSRTSRSISAMVGLLRADCRLSSSRSASVAGSSSFGYDRGVVVHDSRPGRSACRPRWALSARRMFEQQRPAARSPDPGTCARSIGIAVGAVTRIRSTDGADQHQQGEADPEQDRAAARARCDVKGRKWSHLATDWRNSAQNRVRCHHTPAVADIVLPADFQSRLSARIRLLTGRPPETAPASGCGSCR